jgi:hypothetical protein
LVTRIAHLVGTKEGFLMTNEHQQLLTAIGKYAIRSTNKKEEWMLGGIVQAVLPDGRAVVKDTIFGQVAIWSKGTWKVAEGVP